MKYIINSFEKKNTATGKVVATTTLTGTDGLQVSGVSIWSDFPDFPNVKVGSEVDGDVVTNAKGYKSLYPIKTSNAEPFKGSRGVSPGRMSAVMDKKAENIEHAQENKNFGIKISSTLRMAVDIVVAHSSPDASEAFIQQQIKKWREFLWLEWDKENKDYPPY